jgi:NTP pyrophosphatase (non-canonical NTP hydrolase)
MKKLWQNYSLSLVLAGLFLLSWLLQFLFQISVETHQAMQHGQNFEWNEFWASFFKDTFENWQSEFLQLLTFVSLTAFLMHRGSPESKDADEQMEKRLDRIEASLKRLKNN